MNFPKTCLFIILCLLVFSQEVFTQIKYSGHSVVHKNIELHHIPSLSIAVSQTKQTTFIKNREQGKHLKIDVFAISYDTLISPSTHGVWISTPQGKKIWTFAIKSENARSINLICNPYKLNPGVKLFVTDSSGNEINGAFTFRNNKPSGVLPVNPVYSDYVLVELQLDPSVTDFGEFGISRISIEPNLSENLKYTGDEWYGASKSCHEDVNCFDSRPVAYQKYSVVRYIYNGTSRCTGTLVNNTLNDGTPYILTAGHCIGSDWEAATAVYSFNYVSPSCNGPDDIEDNSIAGSELVSHSSYVDFSLMKLYEKPPSDYRPLYSGWNISDEPCDTTYTLHHPQGDVMKIAYNTDEIEYGSSENNFLPNSHWLVRNYEVGSTENGSSGSALFNEQNAIIGTLSEGNAVCSEEIEDLYQELAFSWDKLSDSNRQLKTWLDPVQSGVVQLNSYEPYPIYRSASATNFNFDTSKALLPLNNNENWGYISGHNYLNQKQFAEEFYAKGYKYLDAVIIRVDKLNYTESDSRISIKIWNSDMDVLYSQDVYCFEITENQYQVITLKEPVLVEYKYYTGYEIYYDNTSDTIAVGVAETSNSTAIALSNNLWQPVTRDGDILNASLAIGVITFDYIPDIDDENFMDKLYDVEVYPSITSDKFHIVIKNKISEEFDIIGYNLNGINVFHEHYTQTGVNIPVDITNLSPGLYLFKIIYDNKASTIKIIKSK